MSRIHLLMVRGAMLLYSLATTHARIGKVGFTSAFTCVVKHRVVLQRVVYLRASMALHLIHAALKLAQRNS